MQFTTANGVKFQDGDILNIEDYSLTEKGQKFWVFHDHGFVLGVVISEYPAFCLQDAIDKMVDEDKLDRYQIKEEDYADYKVFSDNPDCVSLGNAGEPFDIEGMLVEECTCPVFSFVKLMTFNPLAVNTCVNTEPSDPASLCDPIE